VEQTNSIIGIYDFGVLPYALGDVLTWNVMTAIRCVELERSKVDVHICLDAAHPSYIDQHELVNADNYELFFTELYSAFCTSPTLGTIYIHRSRDRLLTELQKVDTVNAGAIQDYLSVLECDASGKDQVGPGELALRHYFTKYIQSHSTINKFAAKTGEIPLLKGIAGCDAEINPIGAQLFANKKVVPFHMRLRRLDVSFGGEPSYARDSNFLEWYEFIKSAAHSHPDVQFVALGRLQEKPLEILRLPNVTNLRVLGMGLGHELTLMLRSDLFIGASSGFAAFANFSSIPYFITKMTEGACRAYDIPFGANKLPFAFSCQELIYEPETSDLLLRLLEKGLAASRDKPRNEDTGRDGDSKAVADSSLAATSRYYIGDLYRIQETGRLLLLDAHEAKEKWLRGELAEVRRTVRNAMNNFADICKTLPQFFFAAGGMAIEDDDTNEMRMWLSAIDSIALAKEAVSQELQILRIAIVLALTDRTSPEFIYRFGELKARLQHASLLGPLAAGPLLPDFSMSLEEAVVRRALRLAHDAKEKWLSGKLDEARLAVGAVTEEVPELCKTLPQFLLAAAGIAIEHNDAAGMNMWVDAIDTFSFGMENVSQELQIAKIAMVLALTERASPNFEYRFDELKARLQHANLRGPLAPGPVLPEFLIGLEEARRRRLLRQAQEAKNRWLNGDLDTARILLNTTRTEFRETCSSVPQYLLPAGGIAIDTGDVLSMRYCSGAIEALRPREGEIGELLETLKRCLMLALTDRHSGEFRRIFPTLKARLRYANLEGLQW